MDREAVLRCETAEDVLALLEERDGWAEPWQDFSQGCLTPLG